MGILAFKWLLKDSVLNTRDKGTDSKKVLTRCF